MKSTRPDLLAITAAVFTITGVCAVAGFHVVVTSAGYDQRQFHLPAVMQIRDTFPAIDFIHLPTATGPLYHVAVAALSGPLSLGEAGTQIVGGLFSALLAGLAIYHTRSVPSAFGRILAAAPLIFSAYFWQSALWMLTDNAAALFSMAALILLTFDLNPRKELAVGFLIALAIATRQTSVWLLLPGIMACGYDYHRRDTELRGLALIRVAGPGVCVLTLLVAMWAGLTPPGVGDFNATGFSPVATTFTFAVAGVFSVPIFLCTPARVRTVRKFWRIAAAVGFAGSVPAMLFPSAVTQAPDHSRRGGAVWELVAIGGDVVERSGVLIALGFVGAFTATLVCTQLARKLTVIVGASLLALAVVASVGAQLFQKYVELPIAVVAVITIVSLWKDEKIVRRWPLIALLAAQAATTIAIVGLPILSG
ncbi:MAG: hypothetical protein CL534_23525 [Ahrensia sp.]|nr:hypothetical protein [Ahrensia sp.]